MLDTLPHAARSRLLGVALFGVLLLGAAGTEYGRQSVKWARVSMTTQAQDETMYLPSELALRLSSLGYGPFYADMLFIQAHAYFLRHFFGDRIFTYLETYIDRIRSLDPDIPELYPWAAKVVRYGQTIDEPTLARSNRFAELGLERFPDDGRLYAHVAFNKYFELRPMLLDAEKQLSERIGKTADKPLAEALQRQLAEQRKQRYELERSALVEYTIAAMLPRSGVDPVFLVTLYLKQDMVDAATQLAESLYFDTTPEQKASLIARLEVFGQGDRAKKLKDAEERHLKEMPYVDEGLYRFLGSAKDLTVPLRWDQTGQVFDEALKALEKQAGAD